MSTIDLVADPIIVGAQYIAPPAPAAPSLYQVAGYVLAEIVPPSSSGTNALAALRLYRGPTNSGPWTLTVGQPLSEISRANHLYDLAPVAGVQTYYYATTIDDQGNESAPSAVASISMVPPTS